MHFPQHPANEMGWCPEHHETPVDNQNKCVLCGAKTVTLQQHEHQDRAEVTAEA